jgi:glycosyltransferase involved in cell wall biosynthesis
MSVRRVIYITYDGLNEQLGLSQVLPYVRGLARLGHEFEILSFEKPGSPLAFRRELEPGIRWTALRYHKEPALPATAFDMLQGLGTLAIEGLFHRADLVHVRSYVPAAFALPFVEAARVPLLFDMRGLWADERVEAGRAAAGGRQYRGIKGVERVLLRRADAITTLTLRLQRYLRHEYAHASEIAGSIHTIPTCVDLDHFRPDVPAEPRVQAELAGHRVLLYLGAIGSYYLPKEMGQFYLAWRKYASPARFLVVSRQDPGEIRQVLADAGVAHELVYRSATRDEVPGLIRCAHASFGIFAGRILAGHGCAPTKTGEVLACGVPFASSAVGDIDTQLGGSAAGVSVVDTTTESLDRCARELAHKAAADGVGIAARQLAERWFSLEDGVRAYDAIYRGLPRAHRDKSVLTDTTWPPAAGQHDES